MVQRYSVAVGVWFGQVALSTVVVVQPLVAEEIAGAQTRLVVVVIGTVVVAVTFRIFSTRQYLRLNPYHGEGLTAPLPNRSCLAVSV